MKIKVILKEPKPANYSITSVTLEEIDQLIADWITKIDRVSHNLMDLHGLSTYQRLSGAAGFPKVQLTGITEMEVNPALEAMSELFQHFNLLLDVIDRATSLRKQIPRFLGAEQKLDEIKQLLTGTSIQLAIVQIPLAQRGLLSAAETAQAISPNQLLTAMTNAFQVAKDIVLAVDGAWLRLESTLAKAEAEILALEKLADAQGLGSLKELVITRQKIELLRNSLETDPLGVSIDFDREIAPEIGRVKAKLEQLVKDWGKIREDFAIARHLLQQLVEFNQEAKIALAESQEKVLDCFNLIAPLEEDKIEALSQWLTRLETKLKEGLFNPVRVGLDNWLRKAKEYLILAEKTWIANKAPLETRQELRGRLDGLQAKALARGLAEDTILCELAQRAKQLLYTRPTPLDKAIELVCQYEKRLNGKLHSK